MAKKSSLQGVMIIKIVQNPFQGKLEEVGVVVKHVDVAQEVEVSSMKMLLEKPVTFSDHLYSYHPG